MDNLAIEAIQRGFDSCYFNDVAEENYDWNISEELDETMNNFYQGTGATKFVCYPEGSLYVIKVPYKGTYEEGYFDDDDEWVEGEFEEFSGANNTRNWDYCLTEVIVYHKAKAAKLNKFFAKTKEITTVKSHPIYIQQRAETYYSYANRKKVNKLEKENIYYTLTSKGLSQKAITKIGTEWLADAIDYYGLKSVVKLLAFLEKEQVSDLHNDNLGYINGRPVIIDYSSYNH